ncbi:MAG: hypothetical protein HYR49_08745 [Gammaproteobacteria bacterium]|nr:hypothetical protein [Gammaproteobacteria bacterium]
MNIRTVGTERGMGWVADGFDYFRRSAGIWIAITVVWLVIFIVLGFLPFIGSLLSPLLTPVFAAGVLLGCKALDEGGELKLDHLFRGFSTHTASLILLGALYLVSVMVLLIFMVILAFVLLGGMDTLTQLMEGKPEQLLGNLPMLAVVTLIGLGLYVPILMALWFAPALVALGGTGVADAVSASFHGCLRNIMPFLIWGVVMLVLCLLALIPFGLGLLVLVPMVWAGTYVAYKDIFSASA